MTHYDTLYDTIIRGYICKRGGDTGLVVVIGNAGQDGDQDVGGEDHHGALSQTQECLHPRQGRELDTLICGRKRGRRL